MITGKLLGISQAHRTGRGLARVLDIPYGKSLAWNERYQYIFRYGNATHVPSSGVIKVINTATAINNARNKYRARLIMKDNDIPVPKVYTRENLSEADFPIIARPYNHYRGKHFYLVSNHYEAMKFINRGYFLQEVIENDTEYRIFVLLNELFETNVKVPEREDGRVSSDLIRNRKNGWKFNVIRRSNVPSDLKNLAVRANQALGLDWGAVDCCTDIHGKHYVFEINTAPSLIDRKQEKLAEKLINYLTDVFGMRYR